MPDCPDQFLFKEWSTVSSAMLITPNTCPCLATTQALGLPSVQTKEKQHQQIHPSNPPTCSSNLVEASCSRLHHETTDSTLLFQEESVKCDTRLNYKYTTTFGHINNSDFAISSKNNVQDECQQVRHC